MAVSELYQALTGLGVLDLGGAPTETALRELIIECMEFIAGAELVNLASNVPGKQYRMGSLGARRSRPINAALFAPDIDLGLLLNAVFSGENVDLPTLDRCLYTAAMSYPVTADLQKDNDKKTPGTFFEMFVGHIVARRYGVNPIRQIATPLLDEQVILPTDFIFQLGGGRRIHLPVKTSTRERVVQAWAHQAMLSGMHGAGAFKGILVCLTETNKQNNQSVVEVCLPDQWRAYQRFLAELTRVYYFDPPQKYIALRETFPHIQVWPFSRFFQEADGFFNQP